MAKFISSSVVLYAKYRSANRPVTSGLSSSAQACFCHGTAKLLGSQFPARPHESAFRFQQSEPLHPDNLFSRCPVMVLFEFPITVEGNKNILTFSQICVNRCLAVQ